MIQIGSAGTTAALTLPVMGNGVMSPWASVAVTVNENGPDAVGVPDSRPALVSVNPAGKARLVTGKAKGS